MDHIINEEPPFIKMVDGQMNIELYFSDALMRESENTLAAFANSMNTGTKECTLSILLPLRNLLDEEIDGRRSFPHGKEMKLDEEFREYFQAIKSDLLHLVQKIDDISYYAEETNV